MCRPNEVTITYQPTIVFLIWFCCTISLMSMTIIIMSSLVCNIASMGLYSVSRQMSCLVHGINVEIGKTRYQESWQVKRHGLQMHRN